MDKALVKNQSVAELKPRFYKDKDLPNDWTKFTSEVEERDLTDPPQFLSKEDSPGDFFCCIPVLDSSNFRVLADLVVWAWGLAVSDFSTLHHFIALSPSGQQF